MWFRFVLCAIFACVGTTGKAAAQERQPVTFFNSVEGAFDGGYASTGFDVPLAVLPGAVVRLTAGSGLSRWLTAPYPVLEGKQSARLLAGWRVSGDWGVATLFGGLAVERRTLPPGVPDRQVGTRFGPAAVLDAWLKPAERLAVQVYGEFATPFNAASLRVAPGYEVAQGVFVGPEAGISLHHGTMRSRAGVHVTGLRIGAVGVRLSGGFAHDRGGRGGAYGTLSLWRHY